ncbi:hypothetical protein AB0B28_15070 [Glycomyces sp. NPDC046736]|uniref:hypothetical protein n=1 Tax=Glycomyces sp. NPDC046736 TaxID=3155615 RepID=UPI0033DDB876
MKAGSRSQSAVHERIRPQDAVLFLVTAALLVALPWMLVSAGSEPVEYRDQRTLTDVTVPAWSGLLAFVIPFLVWPGMKAWYLLKKPAAAKLGPGGMRLFDDFSGLYLRQGAKKVNLGWDEVRRVVLWRRRTLWLKCIPGWTSQVGVEKRDDWYEADLREPTAKDLNSREHRPDGSPIRLGCMLRSRSVRLSPAAFNHLAAEIARFAPQVEVVDERTFGKRRVLQSGTP